MADWPVTLSHPPVVLRPLRQRDRATWALLRQRNESWLGPWEATSPDPVRVPLPSFRSYVAALNRQARGGSALPFVVEYQGEFVGQLTVSGITYGSLSSAAIGYWISEHVAGRGIMPMAVALACDYCFIDLGLHRVEINIRPQNAASLRIVAKLGFRDEGLRERYPHINGVWADHRTFALTREDLTGGLVDRCPPVR